MIVKLTKPIEVMGKQVEELDLDLASITGADLMDAYRHAESQGKGTGPSYSMACAAFVAARACKVSPPTILELCARDFNVVCSEAAPLLEASV